MVIALGIHRIPSNVIQQVVFRKMRTDMQHHCFALMEHVNVHQQVNGTGQAICVVSELCQDNQRNLEDRIVRLAQIKTFEGTCITDQQCDGTLQLICNGSICICAGSTPYGTWFWNGTQCGMYQ